MNADWRQLSSQDKMVVREDTIELTFEDGRRHVVNVEELNGKMLRFWSIVARPAALSHIEEVNTRAWTRNRVTDLVGFKSDHRGRLIGETWVPVVGLDADEWNFYVRRVAWLCDRFEYLLTGRDME